MRDPNATSTYPANGLPTAVSSAERSSYILQPRPLPSVICRYETGYHRYFYLDGQDREHWHDLNIMCYEGQQDAIVISNGAGLMANTADLVTEMEIDVACTVDLKNRFTKQKIKDSMLMSLIAAPQSRLLILNIISGTARGDNVSEAVREFLAETQTQHPDLKLVVRFRGPEQLAYENNMRALSAEQPRLVIANKTADVIAHACYMIKSTVACEQPVRSVAENLVARAIEVQLHNLPVPIRRQPEQALEDLLGTNETPVMVAGLGSAARTHIREMLAVGVKIACVIAPEPAKHQEFINEVLGSIPVFTSVQNATDRLGAIPILINYAPAQSLSCSIDDVVACDKAPKLVIVAAENLPSPEGKQVIKKLSDAGIKCIGPNSPGLLLVSGNDTAPERRKLGNMPALLFESPGSVSVIGRSGTAVFDIVEAVQEQQKLGMRLAAAIGGDEARGISLSEFVRMLEHDPKTSFIVVTGEAGGDSEIKLAQLIKNGDITKPVIVMMVGVSLPGDVRSGHAGQVWRNGKQDPRYKIQKLSEAGAICVSSAEEAAAVIARINSFGWNNLKVEALIHTLSTCLPVGDISADALRQAYERNSFYTVEAAANLTGLGAEVDAACLHTLDSRILDKVLRALPWAAAEYPNEVLFMGAENFQRVFGETFGTDLALLCLQLKPWNTTHAFRTVNAIGADQFIASFSELRDTLGLTDSTHLNSAFLKNPWSVARVVKWYSRLTRKETAFITKSEELRSLILEGLQIDPGSLAALWESAVLISRKSKDVLVPEQLLQILKDKSPFTKPALEEEMHLLGADIRRVIAESIFSPDIFGRAAANQKSSLAYALRLIREADPLLIKVNDALRQHEPYLDLLNVRTALARNPWMTTQLLLSLSQVKKYDLDSFIQVQLTPSVWKYCLREHQWSLSRAVEEISLMSFPLLASRIDWLNRTVNGFAVGWRQAFARNPRDAVRIIQALGSFDEVRLHRIVNSGPSAHLSLIAAIKKHPRFVAAAFEDLHYIGDEQGLQSFGGSSERFLLQLAHKTIVTARTIRNLRYAQTIH